MTARVFVLLASLAVPAATFAQPAVRRAEQLAADGLNLYRQAAYEQAIAKFEESYRLVPDPNNLFNIGKCYEKMNKFEEAIAAYRRYIVEAENSADRQQVEQRIANLEGRPASVTLTSHPPGATVYVDDTSGPPAGQTPLTLQLDKGNHVLTLRLAGYEQSTRPVRGGFGREIAIDVGMVPVSSVGGGGGDDPDGTGIEGQAQPEGVDKPISLKGALGIGAGSVGSDVNLTATVFLAIGAGYRIPLLPKVSLDIGVGGSLESREAADPDRGVPVHNVRFLTFLLEPALFIQLSPDLQLFGAGGLGVMNMVGLVDHDIFFADPGAEAPPLLGFIDIHAAGGVWVTVSPDIAISGTLSMDFSPAREGVAGDVLRFGIAAGAVYRL